MAIKQLELPVFRYDDPTTGAPLAGGLVYIYASGTTTSVDTWQDSSQGTLNSNPVVLDGQGEAKIWFAQDVSVVVKSADDLTTYFTEDNISPTGGTSVVHGNYNLALNGSFESGSGSDVTNWTIAPYSGATIEIDTTNVTHGKQSLKFDGLAGVGGGIATSTRFDVTTGANVKVMLDTMASNATTTNDVRINWYQKDDSTPSAVTATDTLALPAEASYPTSMTSYEFNATVPSDATRAEIEITGIDALGSNLDADCYFDNIFVLNDTTTATTQELNYVDGVTSDIQTQLDTISAKQAVLGTAVSTTSGTTADFTGIPSGVNEVTVILDDITSSSAQWYQLQLGDSVGIETSGYAYSYNTFSGSAIGGQQSSSNSYFQFLNAVAAGDSTSGIITLKHMGSNRWIMSSNVGSHDGGYHTAIGTGTKTISAELTQIRLKTGTGNFTGGSFNVIYN